MPHLTIEYSVGLENGLNMATVAQAAHSAMVETGIFPIAGIRVRLLRADYAIVADGLEENDFLAMTLCVGAGRTTETLQAAGALIFAAMQTILAHRLSEPHFALSLDIRVNDPDLSWKDTPIHARLSKKD